MCELAGFAFEIKKRKAADSINKGLGVKVDLSNFQRDGIITFTPTKKRVREVLRDLQQSQLADDMPPCADQSFQGRMSFTLTLWLLSDAWGAQLFNPSFTGALIRASLL
jgi:hypothetical protein